MSIVFISLRNLIVMTFLLGVLYPLVITGIGQLVFPIKSMGSLLTSGNTIVGSELIAQKFTRPEYFWPRPSSIDYTAHSSGASQKSATSIDLKNSYEQRQQKLGASAPSDLLWASGSGLDPHISIESANFQLPRIVASRGMDEAVVRSLIQEATDERFLGFMGQPRVNVLDLNLLLNKKTPR